MMKKLIAMLLALVMVLGLVACGSEKPVETNAPDAGTQAPVSQENETPAATGSVYWLNFKPESDEALQKIAALYTDKTGAVHLCMKDDDLSNV